MFFFIAGFGHPVRRNYGALSERRCEACGTRSAWQLVKVTRYITFFFLPLIPHGRSFWVQCSNCNHGFEVSKEQFDHCLKVQNDFDSGNISVEQRDERLAGIFGESGKDTRASAPADSRIAEKLAAMSDAELRHALDKDRGIYSAEFIEAAEEEMRRRGD